MVAVPAEVTNPTLDAIYKSYEACEERRFSRRLGASQIGDDCERALWLSFRWVTVVTFEGRMLRLFQTGHLQEDRMADDLRATGASVMTLDEETGQQWELTAHGDHFVAKMDGVAVGIMEAPKTWHVAEFKTHNDKSFKALKKDGLKKSKPKHYAQVQVEMLMSGMERTLYMAVNKDTDELHVERVKLDREYAQRMMDRAGRVIFSARPASRISEDPGWYQCKFCDHRPNCHEGKAPEINCRTCAHSTPLPEGGWRCEKVQMDLNIEIQRLGCIAYHAHPDLVK